MTSSDKPRGKNYGVRLRPLDVARLHVAAAERKMRPTTCARLLLLRALDMLTVEDRERAAS